MLAFVIGPSGVGKSTLLSKLSRGLGFEVLDLDAEDNRSGLVEWNPNWEVRRWSRDAKRLAELSVLAQSQDIVVDVGAGSLQTADGRAYFHSVSDKTVAIMAPWQQVYSRRQPRPHSIKCFRETEYSPERLAVYGTAKFIVDASVSQEQALSMLEHYLTIILRQ